jgi:hypothetical protein
VQLIKGGILNTNCVESNSKDTQVHGLARRKPKWLGLADKVYSVRPRHSLTVEFPNIETANEASDFICNDLNKRSGQPVFRKQIVLKQNGQATVYFSHLTSGESKKAH